MKNHKVLIIGHRGYSEIAPENTALAFEAAHLFNFDGIEIDVHQTKDNKLVVIHDETIDRTSDGKGSIKDLTLAELRKFDYGCKFNPYLPQQKLLTFEEFLTTFGSKFKVINVEIKTDVIHYPGIEKRIYEVHQKIKPQAQIIYSGFNFKSLEILYDIDPSLELGFLFVGPKDLKGKETAIAKICKYLHPWAKSIDENKTLKYYQSFNLPLNLWTVDQRKKVDYWTNNNLNQINKLKNNENIYSLISNSKF